MELVPVDRDYRPQLEPMAVCEECQGSDFMPADDSGQMACTSCGTLRHRRREMPSDDPDSKLRNAGPTDQLGLRGRPALSTNGMWVTPQFLRGRPSDTELLTGLPAGGDDGSPAQTPNAGCPCCIGPPDSAFAEACESIFALGIDGVSLALAEKFVRICENDRETMRISKSKAKVAVKLRKPPLSAEEVEQMQQAVLRTYRMICITSPTL